jgi:streptogramin lyase
MRKREESPAEVLESILLLLAEVGEAVLREGNNQVIASAPPAQASHSANDASQAQYPVEQGEMQLRQRSFR